MKRAIALSTAGMLIAAFAMTEVAVAGVNLDGLTFIGEIGKKGQKAGDRDEFIFRNGTFRSTACDRFGFGPGAYGVTHGHQGKEAQFQAQTISPTDGKMTWNGKVTAWNRIEGTSVWEKPGQAPVENWFKGTLKK